VGDERLGRIGTIFPKRAIHMGILTLKQDGKYVISSDRSITDAPVNRPPKGKPSEHYQIWTANRWSLVKSEAMTFASLDEADQYVKANYGRLTVATPNESL
jgi:hypothetical protein